MTCPARNPRAPMYTCWQRIPGITDPREILRCQQCPQGRALIASVSWRRDADQADTDTIDAPQQEDIIMDKQTYTVPELSKLIGITTNHIYNAKTSKSTPRSGSMQGAVLDAMRKLGITWEQIVSAPKSGGRKAAGAHARNESLSAAQGSAPTGEGQQITAAEQVVHDIKPAVSVSRDDGGCSRWSLDMLIKAVRAKLPAKTSITISA